MVLAGLAAAISISAWDYRPARFFVLMLLDITLIVLLTPIRLVVHSPGLMIAAENLFYISVGLFSLTLLWMLSQLFMPQWWQGRRPIIWISLPYVVVLGLIALDFGAQLHVFFGAVQIGPQGASYELLRPQGLILLILLACSYLVPLAILAVSALGRPESRTPIAILFGGVALTATLGFLNQARFLGAYGGLLNPLPILLALTYVIVRSRLVIPTKVALDMALRESSDLIVIADTSGAIVYANRQAEQIGLAPDQVLAERLAASSSSHEAISAGLAEMERLGTPIEIHAGFEQRRIMLRLAPVVDGHAHRRGTLIVGRDVTDLEQRVEELATRNAEQGRLIDLVATLETPSVTVAEGVLLAPIVGVLDSRRAQALTARLLRDVYGRYTRLVILDVSGVPVVDPAVAQSLIDTARALRLLGCQVVVSGISAMVALSLVQQGIVLGDLAVANSPQEALARA
jgi:anti-anti-sigma regulatory factor/PAS domain-containing protein